MVSYRLKCIYNGNTRIPADNDVFYSTTSSNLNGNRNDVLMLAINLGECGHLEINKS